MEPRGWDGETALRVKERERERDRDGRGARRAEDGGNSRGGTRARGERARRRVAERIGRVVCCGLLRLGRDSSAPATGGGFSREPRGVELLRERTNPERG